MPSQSRPAEIRKISLRKIPNSRGEPAIEADVETSSGFGRAGSPSGASAGKREAVAFPQPAEKLIASAKKRLKPLIGMDASDQKAIDEALEKIDGTENFASIGGSVATAVSIAAAFAAADSLDVPLYKHVGNGKPTLPYPLGVAIGGGAHAGRNAPDIQEFLVIPWGAKTFAEAVWTNIAVHRKIRERAENADPTFAGGRDFEGGWAVNATDDKALEIVERAATDVRSETGVGVRLGLDFAASQLWDERAKRYVYRRSKTERDAGSQLDYVLSIANTYKLAYVEDPFREDDFESHAELTRKAKFIVCGDDLFTTNADRILLGAGKGACNSAIIKPNQAGTLTRAADAVRAARKSGWVPVVSHRAGETNDAALAHLAVAWNSPLAKIGITGGERTAKLNELMRIEESTKIKMAELR